MGWDQVVLTAHPMPCPMSVNRCLLERRPELGMLPWWTQGYSAGIDRGLWEDQTGPRRPGEPGLTSSLHSSPAEASQHMAELSEVLVLRMENHDQQQKEVTQLCTQVTNLQQRCQLVRQGVWGAPSSSRGPREPKAPFPCPFLLELSAQPGPRSDTEWEEISASPPSCPSSQERDQSGPGIRSHDTHPLFGGIPCDLQFKGLPKTR